MQQGQMNYDRAITVFSPDGRLFQVEYAREAVKKGSTALGLKFSNGVVLISDRKVRSRLVEQNSVEKIQLIDDYVAAVTSGLVADARVLIDFSRVAAQQEKVTYGGLINMEDLKEKEAVALGIAALKVALEEEGGVKTPEIATITVGNKYYFYTKEEAAKFTS